MSTPFSYTNPSSGKGYGVENRMCLGSNNFRRQYEAGDVPLKSQWGVRDSEEDDEDVEDNKADVINNMKNGSCGGAGGVKMDESQSNSSCCVCFSSGEEPRANRAIGYRNSRGEMQNGSGAVSYTHLYFSRLTF